MSHTDLSLEQPVAARRDAYVRHGPVDAPPRLRRRVAVPIILMLSLGMWVLVWKVAALGVALLIGA